tara:strand:+ start:1140 stop:1370 length:231 start_codon:yes stop_codon:yes gene_type:complete
LGQISGALIKKDQIVGIRDGDEIQAAHSYEKFIIELKNGKELNYTFYWKKLSNRPKHLQDKLEIVLRHILFHEKLP